MNLTPMRKADLIDTAKQLPPIPFMDHERLILIYYSQGGWESAQRYVNFVNELHRDIHKPNKPLYRIIIDWLGKYTSKVRSWLREAVNRLKQLELR